MRVRSKLQLEQTECPPPPILNALSTSIWDPITIAEGGVAMQATHITTGTHTGIR